MNLKGEVISEKQTAADQQTRFNSNRRRVLIQAGTVLGASGALGAFAIPAHATTNAAREEIDGLWESVISAADNSFPPFKAFSLYGGGIWIGSGQPDLTPAALSSSLWAATRRIGPRTFHAIGRFWVYDANANPTGFATLDQVTTLSEDGESYRGEGPLQFFDNSGNSLGPPSPLVEVATRVAFL